MKRLFTGFATAAVLASVATPLVNKAAKPQQVQKAQASSTSFLNTAAKQAQRAAKKYGVYPSVMIAQAIVESDWGQSGLAVKGNNLFGMKADDSWTGKSVTMKTQEWNGKKYVTVDAAFRAYPNYEASFADNGKKLRLGVSWQPDRYQGAWIENAKSYTNATKALTGTYATAPTYNKTLNQRITEYDLTQYDPQISRATKTMYAKKSGATYAWPTDHNVTTKSGSVTLGQKLTVTREIKYYNGTARYYVKGQGWINDSMLETKKQASDSQGKHHSTQAPKGKEKGIKIMHNSYVYNSKGKRVTKSLIKEDTTITSYGTKTIKKQKYYRVGKNQYIKAGNVDGTKRRLKHNAYTYDESGRRIQVKTLKKGKRVTTYGAARRLHGVRYYKVGVDQFVKSANF